MLYRTKDGFSRLRKYSIGPYGQITLAIVRITAQKVLAARLEGKDPGASLQAVKLLIVDELGYVPLSPPGAELQFELFSQRYGRGSTIDPDTGEIRPTDSFQTCRQTKCRSCDHA